MKLLVNFLQPCVLDVCIDLSRLDAGMAQHFLDKPQVGSAR